MDNPTEHQNSNPMDLIFDLLDKNENDQAIKLIKENLAKREQEFIEDFVPGLNIITNTSVEVVVAIMPSLLGILDFEDDVIRYSIILSLKDFVQDHKNLIFPYVEDYLDYGSPKKREGMLLFLQYIISSDPKSLTPYYRNITNRLGDVKPYVRKKAVEILQEIGKVDHIAIEAEIYKFLKKQKEKAENNIQNKSIVESAESIVGKTENVEEIQPQDALVLEAADHILKKGSEGVNQTATPEEIKEAAGQVLNILSSPEILEKDELERKQRESDANALKAKIKDDEQTILLQKLHLEEEQHRLERERLEQEKARLEKEKEISIKQQELELVKRELELKRLTEEKESIKNEENNRIQKKLKEIDKNTDSDEDEWEDID
ncbi:MAG: hypothetical protein ACTSVU_00565 [Promethearchaeota archaeon]